MILNFGGCSIHFLSVRSLSQYNKLIKNHYAIFFLNGGQNTKLNIEKFSNRDEQLAIRDYRIIRKRPITIIKYQNFKICFASLCQEATVRIRLYNLVDTE